MTGAVGPPERCVGELGALIEAGARRLVFTFPSRDTDPADRKLSEHLFVDEVMPGLRSL